MTVWTGARRCDANKADTIVHAKLFTLLFLFAPFREHARQPDGNHAPCRQRQHVCHQQTPYFLQACHVINKLCSATSPARSTSCCLHVANLWYAQTEPLTWQRGEVLRSTEQVIQGCCSYECGVYMCT